MTALEISLLALAILFGVPLLIVLIALVFAQTSRGPEDSFLVGWMRALTRLYSRVVHGVRVREESERPPESRIPAVGSCLVVANHRSGADPVLLSTLTRRLMRFLMAREYFETKGLQWLFRTVGAIPVNRNGNDLGAMREALKHLRGGGVIGLFPQGGIQEANATLEEAKSGVALLALRTGSPVLPVYIDGWPNFDSVSLGVLVPTRTRLVVGELLHFDRPPGKPSKEDLERVTNRILEAIRELKERSESPGEPNARTESASV